MQTLNSGILSTIIIKSINQIITSSIPAVTNNDSRTYCGPSNKENLPPNSSEDDQCFEQELLSQLREEKARLQQQEALLGQKSAKLQQREALLEQKSVKCLQREAQKVKELQ